MAILNKLMPLALSVVLSGCYEVFTPEIETSPVLCINSLIKAGEPIEVNVSRTWLFTDQQAESYHSVTDAEVTIYANDCPVDSDYIPEERDKIRIVADSKMYGRAEAEVVVPTSPQIDSLTLIPTITYKGELTDETGSVWRYITFDLSGLITIRDHDVADNFFMFSRSGYYHSGSVIDEDDPWQPVKDKVIMDFGIMNYQAEPIFGEHIDVFESVIGGGEYGFNVFSDRQFSGTQYPLHIELNNCSYYIILPIDEPELLDCGITFDLYSLSASYYNWVNYVWQRDSGSIGDLSEVGFVDPIWAYSNVSTGAGVVAAQSVSTVSVKLDDFLKKAFDDFASPLR